jgi:hypothetical protein
VDDRLLLDCRTVLPAQVAILAAAIVVAARVIVVAGTASPPHAEGGLP